MIQAVAHNHGLDKITRQQNGIKQFHVGEVLSLLTTSLSSIRNLQVALPILKDYGITDYQQKLLMPELESLRIMIDKKIDSPILQVNNHNQLLDDSTVGGSSSCKRHTIEKYDRPLTQNAEEDLKNGDIQEIPVFGKRKNAANFDLLKADFRHDWLQRLKFKIIDAANISKYADKHGRDYTHIYSYNKVMSQKDRISISTILNKTNFRTLTWYFGVKETEQTGLKHFELLYQEPMQSTGKEKFTVYVYYKTKRYDSKEDKLWLSSSEESSCQDEDGEGS